MTTNSSPIPMRDKNIIYCSACGFRYSTKIKKCPQCGRKHNQPFFHKWWFWVIILIIGVGAFSPENINKRNAVLHKVDSEPVEMVEKAETVEQISMSEEEYKAGCESISYIDIARNPNNYVGRKAVFKGKVIQVQEYGKDIVLRVNVTKGEYNIWDDTIYVDYQRKDDNESRVLTDDIITMYGEVKGIKSYTTVLGNKISIPHLDVEYIEIESENIS